MMDTDDLLERLGPDASRGGARRAHPGDPGGRAPLRGAVLRDRRRQGQRQGAAHGRCPVEHGTRRGADAAGAARDHGRRRAIVPMRIGVNTGKVFTGDFGPPYRRCLPRLRRRDQHGGARHEQGRGRADPLDRDRARALAHDLRDDTDRAVRGEGQGGARRAPRSSARSSGARASATPETPLRRPRRASSTLCSTSSRTSRQATAGSIEIGGAAGLGKSRLVQELIDARRDCRVLHARCEEYEASTPYFAVPRARCGRCSGSTPERTRERSSGACARSSSGSTRRSCRGCRCSASCSALDLPPTRPRPGARRAVPARARSPT